MTKATWWAVEKIKTCFLFYYFDLSPNTWLHRYTSYSSHFIQQMTSTMNILSPTLLLFRLLFYKASIFVIQLSFSLDLSHNITVYVNIETRSGFLSFFRIFFFNVGCSQSTVLILCSFIDVFLSLFFSICSLLIHVSTDQSIPERERIYLLYREGIERSQSEHPSLDR